MKHFDFIKKKVKALTGFEVQELEERDLDLLLDEFSHEHPELMEYLMEFLKHHLEESNPKLYRYAAEVEEHFLDDAKYDSIDDDVQRKFGTANVMEKRFVFDDGTY